MGYSCTAIAGFSQSAMEKILQESHPQGPSNTWVRKGSTYFHEQGRENNDGAITSQVMKMVAINRARNCGSIRIEPDGTITRWPTTTKTERERAFQMAEAEYERVYVAKV